MKLDNYVDPVTHSTPDLFKWFQCLAKIRARDVLPARGLGHLVKGPDLHRRYALFQQGMGQFIGACQETVQIIVFCASTDAVIGRNLP